MENSHFLLKLSRLFPSCRFETLPDVAEPNQIYPHENHLSPFLKSPHKEAEKTEQVKKNISIINQSSSSSSGCKFSSGADVETDTFFSLSYNSGDSFRRKTEKCSRRKTNSGDEFQGYELGSDQISTDIYYSSNSEFGRRRLHRRRRRKMKKRELGWMTEESYAVEKSSSEPYEDFRASMLEMIFEKQMFGEEDLESLLICFLDLNECCYHGIIVDVFSEICRTLFCN